MADLRFVWVDVFTDRPFGGNPLVVFPQAPELPADLMQSIAKEFNLSETVFVRPPDDPAHHARLRIFTPAVELPMAGHPTIGAAFVLAAEGLITTRPGATQVVFEEGVGPIEVTIHRAGEAITSVEMRQPSPVFGPVFGDRGLAARLLSLDVTDLRDDLPLQTVSCGVPYLLVPVKTLDAVRRIRLRMDVYEEHFAMSPDTEAIYAFTLETIDPANTAHCRMFAPAGGVPEDPATGSAAGPLGCYLNRHTLAPASAVDPDPHRLEQGHAVGRISLLQVRLDSLREAQAGPSVLGRSIKIAAGRLREEMIRP
ncbi:MAG: PhzF family phenazine biosynthesis protein [Candidatus Sumerlaeia bacterium]|nr:PhzF family phenazine biosynthesis protein [Candidatus Sumerlaeia bacterium]